MTCISLNALLIDSVPKQYQNDTIWNIVMVSNDLLIDG